MSVKTKQLFYRYEKFLEWLRIGNYGELASETRLENIQNIFRMDLRKNMVMISE